MGGKAGGAAQVLVSDAESVCRLCFKAGIPITVDGKHPDDVDPQSGMIRAEQITKQDLTKRGFSVQRVSMYSRQRALSTPATRESKRLDRGQKPAGFALAGVLIAPVSPIHELADENGGQVFRVVATPTEDSEAHAEIWLAKGSNYLKWRLELRSKLGTVLPVQALPDEPEVLIAEPRWTRIRGAWHAISSVIRERFR